MSTATGQSRKVVPAQLGFFAIYNPSLGTTDDTLGDQIVYYSSQEARQRSRHRNLSDAKAIHDSLRQENNEQLRQIGLAQGMVQFGRSFSGGYSVDTVETEKSRIILHELELGWWVLASIDLTILPTTTRTSSVRGESLEEEAIEYSSREVKPAILLLGDVLRAHSTFLLHHASSMSALFVRTRRSKFIGILGRYWDAFLSTWSVLMHGNPASNLYGGIKIAACGELGMGVGEEERGSGEREVLEGFVGRIDGLVDIFVSKFGDVDSDDVDVAETNKKRFGQEKPSTPWLGSGDEPSVEDGAVFLGTGALSRNSIRDVSHWVEDLYRWGPYAYGVVDNPSSNRRSKRSRQEKQAGKKEPCPDDKKRLRQVYGLGDRLPQRENTPRKEQMDIGSPKFIGDGGEIDSSRIPQRRPSLQRDPSSFASTDSESSKSGRFLQYLKLGYGTHWSLGGTIPPTIDHNGRASGLPGGSADGASEQTHDINRPTGYGGSSDVPSSPKNDSEGHYLIGLLGSIGDDEQQPAGVDPGSLTRYSANEDGENNRVLLRTLTVELEREEDARAEAEISIDLGDINSDTKSTKHTGSERTGTSNASFENQDRNKTKKLRVVVYVNKPFIFVFLFELRTELLALASLYRSIHYQIDPLIRPLLNSTTFRASKPDIALTGDSSTPIYDLIWDPKLLTVTSSIPDIPDPYLVQKNLTKSPAWSRIEALNTHMQIINTYISTITDRSELERTCKTSRGWWVVWTRIPESEPITATLSSHQVEVPGLICEDGAESQISGTGLGASRGTSTFETSIVSGPAHPFLENADSEYASRDKEIFLIRRASDYTAAKPSRFKSSPSSGSSEGSTAGPGKLAQGIGVDTKRYIETLLNLN